MVSYIEPGSGQKEAPEIITILQSRSMPTPHLLDELKSKARKLRKQIVLPDATDERTIRAARICVDQELALITLVGDEQEIRAYAADVRIKHLNPGKVDEHASLASLCCNR